MQPADKNESEELAKVAHDVAGRSSKILGDFVQRQIEDVSALVRDEMGIAKAFMDLYARMTANPALVVNMWIALWADYLRLWQAS
jgi:polyhydroxyalkanoate synthase